MEIIVILGSPNKKNGQLYDVAMQRCALAMEEFNKDISQKIILTGGFGEHFNTSPYSHAMLLKKYLVENGIHKNAFLDFALSKNTIEDATLTKEITDTLNVSHLKIVTSDYHLDRAAFIFNHLYASTDISIRFLTSAANNADSELDIDALREHEINALKKLQTKGIENYYKN